MTKLKKPTVVPVPRITLGYKGKWMYLRACIEAEADRETRLRKDQVEYVLALMDSLEAK